MAQLCHQLGNECAHPHGARTPVVGTGALIDGVAGTLGETASYHEAGADPRGEFLAMVLHELRNPLHGIQLAVSTLGDAILSRPRSDWLIAGIERATHQVMALTDDLMELSHATHPTFRLRVQPIDLSAMVHANVERRRIEFERKGLWLALRPRPTSVWVNADPDRLELILGNLLDNAAKYTDAGGEVLVSVTVMESDAVLRIQDTGIGIGPESLPRVFEPFVREKESPGQATRGSGIGLLLVRTLVELHGGRVEAFSPGRGLGSAFVVRLPALDKRYRPGGANGLKPQLAGSC